MGAGPTSGLPPRFVARCQRARYCCLACYRWRLIADDRGNDAADHIAAAAPAARPDRHRLVFLLIAGYLFIWGAFGIVAHLLDAALHLIVRQSAWLADNGWILGAVVLVVAGAFQFGRLKYRCLDQCRSPVGFLVRHWRGRRPSWDALHLGAHHGAFCVGCCWAIMLLMFVVGTGNVGWMLALGATMAVEKNMPWGRRLSRPLGVVLVTWGALVAAVNTG